jgi:HK97 family phage prohead protease
MTATKTLTPFAVKGIDRTARTFEGYASTWDLDLGGDIIHKGAYARTLDHWRAANGKRVIPLVDHHRYESAFDVVGKLVDAREDDVGLWAKFGVAPVAKGDELLTLVEGDYLSGLSIGYEAVPSMTERKDGVRHIRELKLYEVSVVIWGMNPHALIDSSSVKSLLDAARAGTLTDEEKTELRALLTDASPAPEPAAPVGLAPDDPARLAVEAIARDVILRSLAARS